MARLLELLTPEEVRLLGLVPALPAPLEQFLASEVASRAVADQLMYALLATIPGAQLGPIAGDYTWVSPYRDYPGWLAWFMGHRRPVARRQVDPDLALALELERLARAGSDDALRQIATNPAWLNREVGSNARAGNQQPQRRRPRRTTQQPDAPSAEATDDDAGPLGSKGVVEEYVPRSRVTRRPGRGPLSRF